MSNIERVRNIPDLERKLSESELAQYNKFDNKTRKLQYLVGHAIIKDVCNQNVKTDKNGAPQINGGFISIAHKDNWVLVAVSDTKVGIDIENSDVERDFVAQSELLGLPPIQTKQDFYKEFVRYEAKLKFGDAQMADQYFYKFDKYIICVICEKQDIKFYELFSDAGAFVNFMCTE